MLLRVCVSCPFLFVHGLLAYVRVSFNPSGNYSFWGRMHKMILSRFHIVLLCSDCGKVLPPLVFLRIKSYFCPSLDN